MLLVLFNVKLSFISQTSYTSRYPCVFKKSHDFLNFYVMQIQALCLALVRAAYSNSLKLLYDISFNRAMIHCLLTLYTQWQF